MNKNATKKEYILFILNTEYYSVRIEELDQVIHTPTIRHVPNLPNYIKGVIDIEEQMVPVLDLKARMSLERLEVINSNLDSYILIFEQENRLIGFTADKIFELKEIDIEPKKDFTCTPEEVQIFSEGTLRIEDENFPSINGAKEELITVLSLKKIHDVIKKELNIDGDF